MVNNILQNYTCILCVKYVYYRHKEQQSEATMAIKFIQFHTTKGDEFFAYTKNNAPMQKYFKTEKKAIAWAAKNGHEVLSVEYI